MKQTEIWIDQQQTLDQFLASIRDIVAVDTEFVKRRTFFHQPALMQLATADTIALVDLVAPINIERLEQILLDPKVTKVAHGSSEDLLMLRQCFGVVPKGWVDVQIAMGLVFTEPTLSYAGLVERLLGIELEKEEQTSNWLKRPLREDQLSYAARDVAYLIECWQRLQQQLTAKNRLSWFEQDMALFLEQEHDAPGLEFRKYGSPRQIEHDRLPVLRRLFETRNAYARARDIPLSWLASNQDLVFLAQHPRGKRRELVAEFGVKRTRRFQQWLAQARRDAKVDKVEPTASHRLPRSRVDRVVKRLKPVVAELAEELSLSPQVLATSNTLREWTQNFLKDATPPTHQTQWRTRIVAEPVKAALEQHESARNT